MLLFWFPATLELLSFLDSFSLSLCTVLSPLHPLPFLPSFFLSNSLSPFPSESFHHIYSTFFSMVSPRIILIHIHPFQSLPLSLSLLSFHFVYRTPLPFQCPLPKPRLLPKTLLSLLFIIFYTILNPRISLDLLS